MDLNTFGTSVVTQLSRIANSLETIEKVANGGALGAPTPGSSTNTSAGEKPAAKGAKPTAAEKKAAEAAASAASAPKADRPAVNAALVALKDTVSKEAAQAVYQKFGYTAMSKIEEKDFDAIKELAEAELEKAKNTSVEDANEEDDL